MKVNKMIYIDLDILKEMMKYCENNDIKISALIESLWSSFKERR